MIRIPICPTKFFWQLSIFFFQGEDGIRDNCVTGVQTCALPISTRRDFARPARPFLDRVLRPRLASRAKNTVQVAGLARRSEERRVGKEGRPRVSAKAASNSI